MADIQIVDAKFLKFDGLDKVLNVGWSENDFTNAYKQKLDLIEAGGQVNIIEGVKVNGTALSIASKIVDILIATGTANGTLAVNNVDVAVKGLAALAYKAQVSQTDLDTALAAVLAAKAENTDLTSLGSRVTTLEGTGTGSVKKMIDDAFDDFANKVSDDKVVNSYKELIDWVATHGGEAASMADAISTIEAMLTGIGGTDQPATVQAAISAAVDALSISSYYTKTQTDNLLSGKVDKETGKGLSTNDFTTAYKNKLDAIADSANKTIVTINETDGIVQFGGIVVQ